MDLAQASPAHICTVVPPNLPHYHGTLDAVAVRAGGGGIWLPCTEHIRPTIWCLKWPADIKTVVREGKLSMANCESGAYFVQECILNHLLQGRVVGISTHNFSSRANHKTQKQRRISVRQIHARLPRDLAGPNQEGPGRLHPLAGKRKFDGGRTFPIIRVRFPGGIR
jgi:hypothetical protein